MSEITHADLIAVQTAITDTVRYEVTRAETGINTRIEDLKKTQETHSTRLQALEERTKPSGLLDLTPRQKKLLWTAALGAGGACLEGLRRLFAWVPSLFVNGVTPR